MNTKTISSDRISLRGFCEDDAENIFAYRSLDDVAKYQYWEPYTKEETLDFIKRNHNSNLNRVGEWIGLAVIRKDDLQFIGDCALRINEHDAEIGCNISPKYQKLGFAKEALCLLINHCFENNAINEVFGITDSENIASIQLMESLGMLKSPEFEEKIICKGRISIEHKYLLKRTDLK